MFVLSVCSTLNKADDFVFDWISFSFCVGMILFRQTNKTSNLLYNFIWIFSENFRSDYINLNSLRQFCAIVIKFQFHPSYCVCAGLLDVYRSAALWNCKKKRGPGTGVSPIPTGPDVPLRQTWRPMCSICSGQRLPFRFEYSSICNIFLSTHPLGTVAAI